MKILKLFNIPVKPKKLRDRKDLFALALLVDSISYRALIICFTSECPKPWKTFRFSKMLACQKFHWLFLLPCNIASFCIIASLLSLLCSFWHFISTSFFCPWKYFVFLLCLSIFVKQNSFCAQTGSKLLAPFFVSLFFWYSKHLFRGYAQFSFLSYFYLTKILSKMGSLSDYSLSSGYITEWVGSAWELIVNSSRMLR